MPRGRDLILKALDNLNEEDFQRFKSKLLTVPLRDGYCPIPRGTLQALDRVDLTEKIVSYYLEGYGWRLRLRRTREEHFWEAPIRTIYIMD